MGDYVLWFPKAKKQHIGKISKSCSIPYWIQYYLPNNTTLLVIIDKFHPNLILVNVNKLKPYRFYNLILKGLEAQMQGGRDAINGSPQGNITKISSKENPIQNFPKDNTIEIQL